MAGKVRAERVGATRERILSAAERLFAEHGVSAVSNRQVSEAAGQGNNAAVGYHFGTKADLVRAIARRHAEPVDRIRERMMADIGDSTDVRDWVACLVRPVTEHLAAQGNPTWCARFIAQVVTDPSLRAIIAEETHASLRKAMAGFHRCLPELPADVRAERSVMAWHLITHVCAERERALAKRASTPRPSWSDTATGLIDALVGLWLAPVSCER
ncbi:TetR family transcriptional regulator [Microbispora hainanensis]|uniref:TetR/AcrR family transcriptional regulator n=1 Tax=Microbispora hainanensis TaxID=568844 RepID=UPI00340448AF